MERRFNNQDFEILFGVNKLLNGLSVNVDNQTLTVETVHFKEHSGNLGVLFNETWMVPSNCVLSYDVYEDLTSLQEKDYALRFISMEEGFELYEKDIGQTVLSEV